MPEFRVGQVVFEVGDAVTIDPHASDDDLGNSPELMTIRKLGIAGEVIERHNPLFTTLAVRFEGFGSYSLLTTSLIASRSAANNSLQRLWDSTMALYERFGLNAQNTPPAVRRKVFLEEVGEVIEASALAQRDSHPTRRDLLSLEAADVIVTVLGLCQAHGVTLDEINEACEYVAGKNDGKTSLTHQLVNGKITRKSAQELLDEQA